MGGNVSPSPAKPSENKDLKTSLESRKQNAKILLNAGFNHLNGKSKEDIEKILKKVEVASNVEKIDKAYGEALNLHAENKKALNKQVRTNEKESGKEKKEAQTPEKKGTKKETQNEEKDKLNKQKEKAKSLLAGFTKLNNKQKEGVLKKFEEASSVNDIDAAYKEASALHAKMMLLSGSIHDKAETLESVDYKKANQIRQKPYDEAVQKAENILDMEKGENKTAEEVEQLKQEIETTKKALDGQERLDLAKTESSKQLKNYTYLTQGQVDSVKNFIEKEAKMNKEIEVRMGAAASLNTEMSNLQHIVEENKDLQSKANYKESDDDRKKAYNTA